MARTGFVTSTPAGFIVPEEHPTWETTIHNEHQTLRTSHMFLIDSALTLGYPFVLWKDKVYFIKATLDGRLDEFKETGWYGHDIK